MDEVGPLRRFSSETPEATKGSELHEVSRLLAAPMRLDRRLASVAKVLPSLLPLRRGAITVSAGKEDPALSVMIETSNNAADRGLPEGLLEHIVKSARPLIVKDIGTSALFLHEPSKAPRGETAAVTFIGLPLQAEQETLGALWIDRYLHDSGAGCFDDDVRFLTMVATLLGKAIKSDRELRGSDRQVVAVGSKPDEAVRKSQLEQRSKVDWIVGDSPALKQVLDIASAAAMTNTTVLLRGESGTGKEFFAKAIHALSPRAKKPFVKLNCAALPETLLESELFGHEKGAFTGATGQRAGRFELANGGTLLLDEIGEISAAFQAKLLRVLQEGELERLGGMKTLKVDVRLICATNKDLEMAVARGEFRADLYYRISVVPILLPPLRARSGDIPRLAQVFLDRFNEENGRSMEFAASAIDLISRCYFPGNVRELENCVRRTATLARSTTIVSCDFACQNGQCFSARLWRGDADPSTIRAVDELAKGGQSPEGAHVLGAEAGREPRPIAAPVKICDPADPSCPATSPRLTERDRLIDAMERAGWVQAKAARLLGITPRQVGYALRRHRVDVKKF
ncbi:nif-specific transcriptional activator NifA [Rhizobium altiplani]|uniref:Nif-specific regulatory protein n=3 Tax=Rhizobium/Agrobacterium group TaxID=227290 RepID=A0A109JNV0_9HYPH|nr:nif-specific transcriptional activator NifA [Rhizobium altiplani]